MPYPAARISSATSRRGAKSPLAPPQSGRQEPRTADGFATVSDPTRHAPTRPIMFPSETHMQHPISGDPLARTDNTAAANSRLVEVCLAVARQPLAPDMRGGMTTEDPVLIEGSPVRHDHPQAMVDSPIAFANIPRHWAMHALREKEYQLEPAAVWALTHRLPSESPDATCARSVRAR